MIELLIGGGLIAVGYLTGRATRPRQPKNAPICPCGHAISFHKDGGTCSGQTRRTHYMTSGSRNGKEWVDCLCRTYSGPELISSFTMRGLE